MNIDLSGSVADPSDYDLIGGSDTAFEIPAGLTEADLIVSPIADVPAEPDKRVNLTVTPGAYVVGGSGNAFVTISANDFVVTNLGDPGVDPDGTFSQALSNVSTLGGAPTVTFDTSPGSPFADDVPDTITLRIGSNSFGVTAAGTVAAGADMLTIMVDPINGVGRSPFSIAPGDGEEVRFTGLRISGGLGASAGAFHVLDGTLVLDGCLLTGNSCTPRTAFPAIQAVGGGAVRLQNGSVIILNSTIANNTTTEDGGAFYVESGSLSIANSTISGNTADGSGGGILGGGGSSISLVNVTLADNAAALDGGGVLTVGTLTLGNSILATNSAGISPDVSGGVSSLGMNIVGDGAGSTGLNNGMNGDRVGTSALPIDPLLGSLADNGGTTPTHLPRNVSQFDRSPAVDAGDNGLAVGGLDQRGVGFARIYPPATGTVDIGAVEVQNALPTVAAGIDDQFALEDDPAATFSLLGAFSDLEDGDTGLIYNVVANTDPTLVVASVVNSTDIELTFGADQTGTADITVEAIDSSGSVVEDTFTVTVDRSFEVLVEVETVFSPVVAGLAPMRCSASASPIPEPATCPTLPCPAIRAASLPVRSWRARVPGSVALPTGSGASHRLPQAV